MSSIPIWEVLAIGLLSATVTLAGGSLVLRFRSALELLLAFSSGSIIGVALFDLLPEALNVAGGMHTALGITSALGGGFAIYLAIDRVTLIVTSGSTGQRHFAPASLTLHSLLDGLGIGLAFQVSATAGIIVATGVLAHDLVDGANTVAVSLSNGASVSTARFWLTADSLAPLAGIVLASMIAIPPSSLAIMLAVFGGFFLYIGATELLRRGPGARLSTLAATLY